MARSSFIILSDNPSMMEAQERKLRYGLRSSGLCLEGPYSDRHDSVSKLTESVRSRSECGIPDLAMAALATIKPLGPSGRFHTEKPWIDIPFALGSNPVDSDCGYAGGIMHSPTEDGEGGKIRRVDIESLVILGVAVLRRLGIPSFPAYQHPDLDCAVVKNNEADAMKKGIRLNWIPLPGIVAFEDEIRFLSIIPPHTGGRGVRRIGGSGRRCHARPYEDKDGDIPHPGAHTFIR
jgi:hypothetical protein